MFVQRNTVKAIRGYFNDRLKDIFSNTELKLIVRDCVCSRLGLSFSDYLLGDELCLSESDLLYFRSVVKRLKSGEPFQYIMGSVHFAGIDLKIDRRALIPRPETEELVDWIRTTVSPESKGLVFDLCTGSGCIAFGLESFFVNAELVAVEYSEEAQNLFLENKKHLNSAVSLLKTDVLSEQFWSTISPGSVRLFVSNPPYVKYSESSAMKKHVLDFEPHMALFVEDEDPLLFYNVILKNGIDKLISGGKIYFEINPVFSDVLIEQMKLANLVNITLRKDLQGVDRMLMGQKP
jgi:release factor glutamine methyltransferase